MPAAAAGRAGADWILPLGPAGCAELDDSCPCASAPDGDADSMRGADGSAICVWFDANGKAADYEVFDVYREHDSNFDRLLAWLGLKAKNPQPVTKIE